MEISIYSKYKSGNVAFRKHTIQHKKPVLSRNQMASGAGNFEHNRQFQIHNFRKKF